MRIKLESLVGIAFCAGAAIVLSLLLNDDAEVSLIAPFMCLFVVTMTAFFWGRIVATFGAVAANLTFCFYLFPPRWSIKVSNPEQRIAVIVFQVLAVAAVFLAPSSPVIEESYPRRVRRNSSRKESRANSRERVANAYLARQPSGS